MTQIKCVLTKCLCFQWTSFVCLISHWQLSCCCAQMNMHLLVAHALLVHGSDRVMQQSINPRTANTLALPTLHPPLQYGINKERLQLFLKLFSKHCTKEPVTPHKRLSKLTSHKKKHTKEITYFKTGILTSHKKYKLSECKLTWHDPI